MRLDLPGPFDLTIPDVLVPKSPVTIGVLTAGALAVAYHGHKRGKRGRILFYTGTAVALAGGYLLFQDVTDDQELADAASSCGYGDLGVLPTLAAPALAIVIARSRSVRRLKNEIERLRAKRASARNYRARVRLTRKIEARQAKLDRIIARLTARAQRRQDSGRQPTRRQARVLNIPRVKPLPGVTTMSETDPVDMVETDDGTFEPMDTEDGALAPEAVAMDTSASDPGLLGNPWVLGLGGLAVAGAIGYALTRRKGSDAGRRSGSAAPQGSRASMSSAA